MRHAPVARQLTPAVADSIGLSVLVRSQQILGARRGPEQRIGAVRHEPSIPSHDPDTYPTSPRTAQPGDVARIGDYLSHTGSSAERCSACPASRGLPGASAAAHSSRAAGGAWEQQSGDATPRQSNLESRRPPARHGTRGLPREEQWRRATAPRGPNSRSIRSLLRTRAAARLHRCSRG